jgi:cholesterol oxidase
MQRLSLPIEKLQSHYQVVVIGSGYGGGIAASRLARASLNVCLLERGKEFMPGEFPDTELEAVRETQVDFPHKTKGSSTGLYHFHVNEDISVLTGCGLGGTSLINANVSIQPEPRVFEDPRWPPELRADLHTRLADGFNRAKAMLKPTPYPDRYPPLDKMHALKKSADAAAAPFFKPEINVTFEHLPDGLNHVGVPQNPCVCCGDCVSGCNYAAKNTLHMNYLPDARNFGAEIFTQVSVSHILRRGERYHIHYRLLHEGPFTPPADDTLFLTADLVIVAAGALGSTEILLRSKVLGLPLSDQLGHGFTGNGDVLAFGYNTETEINGVGFGFLKSLHPEPVGPTITGLLDLRNQRDLETGMIIEEGSLPSPLANLLPAAFASAAKAVGEPLDSSLGEHFKQKEREARSLLFGARTGAVRNTQTYLVMAHDDARGQMVLDNARNRLQIHWNTSARSRFLKKSTSASSKPRKP